MSAPFFSAVGARQCGGRDQAVPAARGSNQWGQDATTRQRAPCEHPGETSSDHPGGRGFGTLSRKESRKESRRESRKESAAALAHRAAAFARRAAALARRAAALAGRVPFGLAVGFAVVGRFSVVHSRARAQRASRVAQLPNGRVLGEERMLGHSLAVTVDVISENRIGGDPRAHDCRADALGGYRVCQAE